MARARGPPPARSGAALTFLLPLRVGVSTLVMEGRTNDTPPPRRALPCTASTQVHIIMSVNNYAMLARGLSASLGRESALTFQRSRAEALGQQSQAARPDAQHVL